MNKPYTENELIELIARHEKFIKGIGAAIQISSSQEERVDLRRMLYNVSLLSKTTRSILDQHYIKGISTEQLHKDIQRTTV